MVEDRRKSLAGGEGKEDEMDHSRLGHRVASDSVTW